MCTSVQSLKKTEREKFVKIRLQDLGGGEQGRAEEGGIYTRVQADPRITRDHKLKIQNLTKM